MDDAKVTMKGRLGPGMMIAVDLLRGEVRAAISFSFLHSMFSPLSFCCFLFIFSIDNIKY